MLKLRPWLRVAVVAAVVFVVGCSDDDESVESATTSTAGAALFAPEGASLSPVCLPVPEMHSLTGPTVALRAGESIDLGMVVRDTVGRLAIERFELVVTPSGSERPVRTLDLADQPLPGEVRIPFDGRDDAGRPLGPGSYHVGATMEFVGDGMGLCPGSDDTPEAHETISGELVIVEISV